jgi:hypothetical protein
MRRLIATLVLTCALSGVSLGADIPTCGLTAEEPTTTETTTPGEIHTTDATAPGDIPGVDVTILLTVLDLVF